MVDAFLENKKASNPTYTKADLAKEMGITPSALSNHLNLKRPTPDAFIDGFISKFRLNRTFYETGVGDPLTEFVNSHLDSNAMLIGEAADPEFTEMTPLGNNRYGITVPLVSQKAYAGYIDNYGDPEYIETLSKHTVSVVGNYHGRYFAFAIKGKSLENWTSEEMAKLSIPEDWIVTCRDLPRHHWYNKLHLHRWEFYVFVMADGIICKQVTEHNVAEGWVTAHSLNPNKEEYPDIKVHFNDCLQILNVVHKGAAL